MPPPGLKPTSTEGANSQRGKRPPPKANARRYSFTIPGLAASGCGLRGFPLLRRGFYEMLRGESDPVQIEEAEVRNGLQP